MKNKSESKLLKSLKNKSWVNVITTISAIIIATYVGYAYGANEDLGSIARRVTGSFEGLARLITAGAYVAGIGFALTSILKFKAHKDNPTQIPIGTPIALLFVSAALLFLPTLFGIAGITVFGTTSGMGGIYGVTAPGAAS